MFKRIFLVLFLFWGMLNIASCMKSAKTTDISAVKSNDEEVERSKKTRSEVERSHVYKRYLSDSERASATPLETSPAPSLDSVKGEGSSRRRGEKRKISSNRDLNIPQAGEHDDNEEPAYFLKFLERMHVDADLLKAVRQSRVINVVDQNGEAIWNATIKTRQERFQTAQDGEVLLIRAPKAVQIGFENFTSNVQLSDLGRRTEVVLPTVRQLPGKIKADVVFVMDTTGSMGDEIGMLRDTIYSIYMRLKDFNSGRVELRFGMVLYRDKGDKYDTKVVPFTDKIEDFQKSLFKVTAGGGGDYPEDLVSGLKEAEQMMWRKDAVRLAFVVTDAPAHIDSFSYWIGLAKKALLKRIKIFTIGASGLDSEGEVQLRSLSQLSRGKFIFLTYGEKGNSSGSGTKKDPGKVSHHTGANYTSRSLDDIVVDNVRDELAYQLSPSALAVIRKDYHYEGVKDEVKRRVDNALQQLEKQLSDKKKGGQLNVLMIPPQPSEKSLEPLSEHILNVAQTLNQKETYFSWVDRQFTADILKELKLKLAGFTEGDELPHIESVDVILGGKLYFIGGNTVLFLKAVDAKSSKILAATMIKI